MSSTFQIFSPVNMMIDAASYKDAIKKAVLMNNTMNISQIILADRLNNKMVADINYYQSGAGYGNRRMSIRGYPYDNYPGQIIAVSGMGMNGPMMMPVVGNSMPIPVMGSPIPMPIPMMGNSIPIPMPVMGSPMTGPFLGGIPINRGTLNFAAGSVYRGKISLPPKTIIKKGSKFPTGCIVIKGTILGATAEIDLTGLPASSYVFFTADGVAQVVDNKGTSSSLPGTSKLVLGTGDVIKKGTNLMAGTKLVVGSNLPDGFEMIVDGNIADGTEIDMTNPSSSPNAFPVNVGVAYGINTGFGMPQSSVNGVYGMSSYGPSMNPYNFNGRMPSPSRHSSHHSSHRSKH